MPNPTVTLTRCSSYRGKAISTAIQKQFELLGGMEKFISRGDSVLLKPNLIAPKPRDCAAQTDPVVIIETAKLLFDFGAKPFVGDSPAWGSVFSCAKALELDEHLKKIGVPLKQLNKPIKCRVGTRGTLVGISSVALDADVIINLPKFKSHQQLTATFAVKNMFGCVSGKQKAIWHFKKGRKPSDFCKLLIGIYEYLGPALTIIDAVTVMDGPGPISGRARPLGWLIGGTDPVACETICCRLININPDDLPIIKTAKKMGMDRTDFQKITILGSRFPKKICTDFEPAVLIPLRFSFLRICKSIYKQIVMLTKSAISKRITKQI